MKKITLLLVAIVAAFSANAAVVFEETCGTGRVEKVTVTGKDGNTFEAWPYANQYKTPGWDNAATCTYGGWSVSVRANDMLGTYVWFPKAKADTLTISGINGGKNLTLSFDLSGFENPTTTEAIKLQVRVNGQDLVIPSTKIATGAYSRVAGISVPDADAIELQFSADQSPIAFMLDNIKIEDGATAVENVEADKLAAFVANDVLYLNAEEGAPVRVYAVTGALVLNGVVNNGQVALNGLNNGIYVINVNNQVAKVTVR